MAVCVCDLVGPCSARNSNLRYSQGRRVNVTAVLRRTSRRRRAGGHIQPDGLALSFHATVSCSLCLPADMGVLYLPRYAFDIQ